MIEWRKNGIILDLEKMKYDGGGLNDSFVIIMLFNKGDKGNYLCIMKNVVGIVIKNVIFGNNDFYFLY